MIWGILFFVFGLCLGSFLNAFLYRYATKQTLTGRSFCPACKHQIAWYDLVPVFSWLFLNKKCRYCKKQISVQYPLVELLTALTFTLIGLFSPPGKYLLSRLSVISTEIERSLNFARDDTLNVILLIILFAIFFILLAISIYDYKNKEIPNGFNLFFTTVTVIYISVVNLSSGVPLIAYLISLITGIAAFLFFFAFVLFSKETWMGGGDAKLAFGMGILLGPINTFVAILLASVIGSFYGISIIAVNKVKKTGKNVSHEIPFGPFLVLGTTIAFFFGSEIAAWYAKMFLGF